MGRTLGKFPEPWWSTTWKERSSLFEDEADENGRVVRVSRPDVVEWSPTTLQDEIAYGLYYEKNDPMGGGFQRAISPEEVDLFSDLLTMILKYNPEERLTPKKALDHAWFKM